MILCAIKRYFKTEVLAILKANRWQLKVSQKMADVSTMRESCLDGRLCFSVAPLKFSCVFGFANDVRAYFCQ